MRYLVLWILLALMSPLKIHAAEFRELLRPGARDGTSREWRVHVARDFEAAFEQLLEVLPELSPAESEAIDALQREYETAETPDALLSAHFEMSEPSRAAELHQARSGLAEARDAARVVGMDPAREVEAWVRLALVLNNSRIGLSLGELANTWDENLPEVDDLLMGPDSSGRAYFFKLMSVLYANGILEHIVLPQVAATPSN